MGMRRLLRDGVASFTGAMTVGVIVSLGGLTAATQACGTSGSSNPSSGGPGGNGGSSGATSSSGGGSGSSGSTAGSSGTTGSSSGSSTSPDGSTGVSDAGTPSSDAAPEKSTGCGATTLPTPDSIPDGGGYYGGTLPLQRFKMDVDAGGGTREFILGLPASYDSSQAYPVVFVWHPMGGTDVQVAWGGTSSNDIYGGYNGLRYLSVQNGKPMIFIAGQGLNPNDAGAGWPNTNGEDVAFAKAMVAWLEANYCVDTTRIFSVGFSYGAIMSNTVGCAMGNVYRAIAPMDGFGPGYGFGSPGCVGQVGAWVAHGAQDTTISVDAGIATREYWAQANHCSSTSVATTPAPCVSYQGCDPGYPVDWCEFDGGHQMESFEPPGVWAFLQQF